MSENLSGPLDALVAKAERGEFLQAECAARDYLARRPDDEMAWSVLGYSQLQQRRVSEAAETYQEIVKRFPGNPLHWNNLGTARRQNGELHDAEKAYAKALQLQPDNPQFVANMGLLYLELKRVVAARDCLWRAVQLDPTDYEARIFGCQMCLECGDDDRAGEILGNWQAWKEQVGGPLRVELAAMLLRTGRNEEGEALLRQQLTDPQCSDMARVRLVVTLERFNRLDEARGMAEQLPEPASVTDPDLRGEIMEAQAIMAARGKDSAHARKLLEKLLGEPGAERRDVMTWFLLAKLCDKLDDTSACMEYLRLAHESQMNLAVQLMPELAQPSGDPMDITRYAVSEAEYRNWKAVDAPTLEDSPIFVLGFPRSGTTMLEQMLDAHPDMVSMDEQPFAQRVVEAMQAMQLQYPEQLGELGSAQCDQLRDIYWRAVAQLVHLRPGQRLVDKNPLTMLRLPLLVRIFPNAKIIFVVRHPCDVVFSNYMQHFNAPAYIALCSTLQRLASGYAAAMRFWNRHVELFRPKVFEWRYEEVVRDFDAHVEQLGTFLQLDDTEPLRRFSEHAKRKGYIGTPSYTQVVQPVYASSIGRWHRYRGYFAPVLPLLEPAMRHWGYDA
ncbi:MAG: sulfotransferase family protein [Rhodanobacteraceae bacterium]|nr:MAG: sulfotransferase family protein [Rhodanobacteraceae bacterium]